MTISEILTPTMENVMKKFIEQGGLLSPEDKEFLDDSINIMEEMIEVSGSMRTYDYWKRMYSK